MKFIVKTAAMATFTGLMVGATAFANPIDNSRNAFDCERLTATVSYLSIPKQCHFNSKKTASYLNIAAAELTENNTKNALINLIKSETEIRQFSSEGDCQEYLPKLLDLMRAVIRLEMSIQ